MTRFYEVNQPGDSPTHQSSPLEPPAGQEGYQAGNPGEAMPTQPGLTSHKPGGTETVVAVICHPAGHSLPFPSATQELLRPCTHHSFSRRP